MRSCSLPARRVHGGVLGLLSPGETIALAEGCYYGTSVLFGELERWGVRFVEFDQTGAPPEGVDLIWLEAPSNPFLTFPDMEAARAHPRAVLDRSRRASTPILFRPLEHGADVVLAQRDEVHRRPPRRTGGSR